MTPVAEPEAKPVRAWDLLLQSESVHKYSRDHDISDTTLRERVKMEMVIRPRKILSHSKRETILRVDLGFRLDLSLAASSTGGVLTETSCVDL